MAKYYVTIKCQVEDDDPRHIVSDIAMELGSCWNTLENLTIIAQSEIQEYNNLPESYSCKSDLLVWTEKSGYKEV
jgi:hypothetical protein